MDGNGLVQSNAPGFVSRHTLYSARDPAKITTLGVWTSNDIYDQWRASRERAVAMKGPRSFGQSPPSPSVFTWRDRFDAVSRSLVSAARSASVMFQDRPQRGTAVLFRIAIRYRLRGCEKVTSMWLRLVQRPIRVDVEKLVVKYGGRVIRASMPHESRRQAGVWSPHIRLTPSGSACPPRNFSGCLRRCGRVSPPSTPRP